jgi:hypothetical protein
MKVLNLYATLPGGEPVRPDERFHLQHVPPKPKGLGWDGLFRRVRWDAVFTPNDTPGTFSSYVLLWVFRWYWGSVKCDGTRTFALRNGQLGGTPFEQGGFVMTTTPKELASFRFSFKRPDRERWDNMGGI